MNLVQTVLATSTQNIGKKISGNSHVGRYSKGQISADNIISVDRYIGRSLSLVVSVAYNLAHTKAQYSAVDWYIFTESF